MPLEVDDAVQLLVAAAAVLGGDHAVVVAAAGAALADGERLLGLELGEDRLVVEHRARRGGRRRSGCKI